MAKPIFLAELPADTSRELIHGIQEAISKKLHDYHVLVGVINSKEAKFSCFFDKDLKETDFEEFKKYVMENLTNGQESKV